MVLDPAIYGMGAWWFERSLWLMTLLTVDRKVLCKAGEQAGGPDRCSPAPLFNTKILAGYSRLVFLHLVLFGHWVLAELDGSLRLG